MRRGSRDEDKGQGKEEDKDEWKEQDIEKKR